MTTASDAAASAPALSVPGLALGLGLGVPLACVLLVLLYTRASGGDPPCGLAPCAGAVVSAATCGGLWPFRKRAVGHQAALPPPPLPTLVDRIPILPATLGGCSAPPSEAPAPIAAVNVMELDSDAAEAPAPIAANNVVELVDDSEDPQLPDS